MHVRPFFWFLLAAVCTGVLVFAVTIPACRVLPMRAHIDEVSMVNESSTLVRLTLTDPEGAPIDQAQITSRVYMLTMSMGPQQTKIEPLGQGTYLAQIHFSMAGSWRVEITAHADGFDVTRQLIQLTVALPRGIREPLEQRL